ncbi:MAG: N-acetyltransferase family protein [Candidatus Dormibacteria bacterium]
MPATESTVTLRVAGLEDIPALVALQARSWRSTYRGLVDDDFLDAIPMQKWLESWRAHFFGARRDTRCFVAEVEGRVIGFSGAGGADPSEQLGQDVAELHTIYVDDAHHGRGVGRRLMEAVLDYLRGEGYREVILWVLEGNDRARRFYEAGGWQPDGATGSDCWGASSVARVRYRLTLPRG